jgi:DNA-binding response OmpR family regulator
MILIVTSAPRERAALLALCESRGWLCAGCDSLRTLRRRLKSLRPAAVVTRHRLADGFSDDVFPALAAAALAPAPRILVLLGATATAAHEARQIALGADHTLRDPVRPDVLLAHLAKSRRAAQRPRLRAPVRRPAPRERSPFAGATIDWADRRLLHAGQSVALTPREAQLVELLCESHGRLVTYETLYAEILDRRFTGDTGNLRALLAQLIRRGAAIGLALRDRVEVIPKAGYRLRAAEPAPRR